MTILIDSREKKNKHITAYFDAHKIKHAVSKMYVGDYQRADSGKICIDKKFGLDEVYGCVVSGWNRFADECRRAKEAGITLIILVEEEHIKELDKVHDWVNPRVEKWEKAMDSARRGKKSALKNISSVPPVNSKRIEDRMKTLSKRYGVKWQFCKKSDTAEKILELLEYET